MLPADLASLLLADEDDAPAKAAAYAQALRGQQQLGTLGLLTGDKVLGNVGQSLLAGAGRGEAELGDFTKQRKGAALQRALAAQQAAAQKEREAASEGAQMDRLRYSSGEEMRRLRLSLGAQERARGAAAEAAGKKQALDVTEGLRKELSGNPVTKQFQDVATSFGKINSVAKAKPSAGGDMALIFSFMKMMDPGSSVREGEYANASQATGVPGQIINLYNKAKDGQLLSPEQRADFLTQAQRMYQTHEKQYGELAGRYKAYGAKHGVAPEDIVFGMDVGGGVEPAAMQSPGGAPAMSAEDAAALDWAKANPNDPRAATILQMHGGAP